MKWILLAIAGLIVLVALVALVGSLLPRDHKASRTLKVRRTPQEVWPVFTAVTAASSVPVDILEQDPPRRIVTRVKQTEKMFGGTWTCVIAPAAASAGSGQAESTLTITEDGWVANPIFRFMSRFVIGHHATIDGVLRQVAAQLNEEAMLTGE
jgi:hypothetical protein